MVKFVLTLFIGCSLDELPAQLTQSVIVDGALPLNKAVGFDYKFRLGKFKNHRIRDLADRGPIMVKCHVGDVGYVECWLISSTVVEVLTAQTGAVEQLPAVER